MNNKMKMPKCYDARLDCKSRNGACCTALNSTYPVDVECPFYKERGDESSKKMQKN